MSVSTSPFVCSFSQNRSNSASRALTAASGAHADAGDCAGKSRLSSHQALARLGSRIRLARLRRKLGLLEELELVADPGLDRNGQALSFSVSDKRVRLRRQLNNKF
jgi:hypothetical protein